MENYKDKLVEILIKEKKDIEDMKVMLGEKSRFTKQIDHIRKELEDLKKDIAGIEKNITSKTKELNNSINDLNSLLYMIVSDNVKDIESLLEANLPDGISTIHKNIIDGKNIISGIGLLDDERQIEIGHVSILKDDGNNVSITVLIDDKLNNKLIQQKFELLNPKRIYKVISFINVNLSYHE